MVSPETVSILVSAEQGQFCCVQMEIRIIKKSLPLFRSLYFCNIASNRSGWQYILTKETAFWQFTGESLGSDENYLRA